jgi:hypothetical protein
MRRTGPFSGGPGFADPTMPSCPKMRVWPMCQLPTLALKSSRQRAHTRHTIGHLADAGRSHFVHTEVNGAKAMKTYRPNRMLEDSSVFVAGQVVPPGVYRQINSRREVQLNEQGILPATCDGRVAVYERRTRTWAELRSEVRAEGEK